MSINTTPPALLGLEEGRIAIFGTGPEAISTSLKGASKSKLARSKPKRPASADGKTSRAFDMCDEFISDAEMGNTQTTPHHHVLTSFPPSPVCANSRRRGLIHASAGIGPAAAVLYFTLAAGTPSQRRAAVE